MKIQFYGHSGVKIEDDLVILIDPWLNDNPLAIIKAEDITNVDYIIATHNHFDHVNDIPTIAKNTKGVLLFGNESSGISDELSPFISQKIGIENGGNNTESLNVATATAIVLHHFCI